MQQQNWKNWCRIMGGLLIIALLMFGTSHLEAGQTLKDLKLGSPLKLTLQQLTLLEGEVLSSAMLDQKVVIVTFFASWCGPCRTELKHLKTLYPKYHSKGLEVVAVNLFENFDQLSNKKRLIRFLEKFQLPFSVVEGNSIVSQQFGKITRIPSLFVFDRQGQLAFQYLNQRNQSKTSMTLEEMEQALAALF